MPPTTIAIIGAGPVGLTLARLLLTSSQKADFSITIFEKDASPTSRRSLGGTLDLHPRTGLAAIKRMDLWDEFTKHARFDGEEMRMCDLNGFVYVHQIESPNIEGHDARPEIDRVRLLELLLGSVPGDVVRWGRSVKEVVEEEKGHWKIVFEDGSKEGLFDLIVGADGAWSKARKVLTDVEPAYSGISGLAGTIDQDSAGDDWEKISAMAGKGNNFSFSYGLSMTLQRMGDGSLKTGFQGKRPLEWVQEVKEKHEGDNEALQKVLLEEYKDWVPELQSWIKCSKELWCAPLWELPVGHRFEHKKGITVIGDAAHLMSPFAGEGVNAGMKDALDLAEVIERAVKENSDLDLAVKHFEETMFERAADFMQDTLVNKDTMFAQDAPYSFFVAMIGVVAKEFGYDLMNGWLVWVPVSRVAFGTFWVMGSYGALRRRIRALFRR